MKKQKNYKKAVIDQMMLWIVIFISFVILFFLVIDYYTVVKVKQRSDTLVNYGVRMKALGRDNIDIVQGLNNLKIKYIDTKKEVDLICTTVSDGNYTVKFNTQININTNTFEKKNVHSYASSFNEVDNKDINCTLILRPAQN